MHRAGELDLKAHLVGLRRLRIGAEALLDDHDIGQWSHSELFLIAVTPADCTIDRSRGALNGSELEDQAKQKYQAISHRRRCSSGRPSATHSRLQVVVAREAAATCCRAVAHTLWRGPTLVLSPARPKPYCFRGNLQDCFFFFFSG